MSKTSGIGQAAAAVAAGNPPASSPPESLGDIALERVWSGRMVFEGESPMPDGVTFLPAAHYCAEVVSLPAGLCLVDGAGGIVASFPTPEGVEPPFTMHLGVGGMAKAAVFATKGGATAFRAASTAGITSTPIPCS